MKVSVEFDGQEFLLDFKRQKGPAAEYVLSGAAASSGQASIVQAMPSVFSVLLGSKSFTVVVAQRNAELEVWAGGRRHVVTLSDPRDRTATAGRALAAGRVEIRAQMPGKVIKVLVEQGARVAAGQGVIIVEAMKMQNEMKSPKDGVVQKIHAAEGSTVVAGEALVVID